MPPEAVIAISDLHLGRGNNQDSFIDNKKLVEDFTNSLLSGVNEGVDLTLVLNGDVFDLWEIVGDDELRDDEDSWAATADGLLVPTRTQADIDRLKLAMSEKLQWALDRHTDFSDMITQTISANVKVHLNVGNHDHQLDNNATAAALRDVLGPQVAVGRFYWNESLGFYAEHGDQFSGRPSRSPLDPIDGTMLDEASGFYFLRYVWNRIENKYGYHHLSVGLILKEVLKALLNKSPAFDDLLHYVSRYFRAVRDGVAKLVEHRAMGILYDWWLNKNLKAAAESTQGKALLPIDLVAADVDAVRDELESVNHWVDPALADPALDDQAVSKLADFVRLPRIKAPAGWVPGRSAVLAYAGYPEDDYIRGLRRRFQGLPGDRQRLEVQKTHTVTVGHTHSPRKVGLVDKTSNPKGPIYFNTGSWTKGAKGPFYVWAYKKDGGRAISDMYRLD